MAGTDDLPSFPADAKGIASRDSLGQGAQRHRTAPAVADRRLGGPRALDQDAPDVRRRRRLRGRQPRRAQLPLRHSRARDGGRSATAWRCPSSAPYGSGFLIFSDYMRPAIRLSAIMELPIDLRLHPRFDRRRRGRADPPAGRAADLAARDPGPDHASARRRQRGRRSVARAVQMKHQPVCLILSRQALPTLDRHALRAGRGRGARRLCAGRPARRRARGDPDRHRQRGLALRRRPTRSSTPRASGTGREHAVLGAVRAAGRGLPEQVLPPDITARVAVEQAIRPSAGSAMSVRPAPRSACTASAPRRRSRTCSRKFGFTPEKVLAAAKEQIGTFKGKPR